MEFSTETLHKSKAFAAHGVTFTTRRLGVPGRTEVELATAGLRARQRETQRDVAPLRELDKAEDTRLWELHGQLLATKANEADKLQPILDGIAAVREELAAKPHALDRERLEEASRIADRQIEGPWVKAGLISIDGVTVQGQQLTVDQLIEYGPRELFAEVFQAVWEEAYLSGADSKNSPSPTTSGTKADGPSETSIAPSAEAPPAVDTKPETVPATSPAT